LPLSLSRFSSEHKPLWTVATVAPLGPPFIGPMVHISWFVVEDCGLWLRTQGEIHQFLNYSSAPKYRR
jgi:hypothetical protein